MPASELDIWTHATNIIGRASYGVNGKKHFQLQRERMADMASGGCGGELSNAIMTDTSGHEASIREKHFADWENSDFQRVLEIIAKWEKKGKIAPKPKDDGSSKVEEAVARAYDAFKNLSRDEQIDALNTLAEGLGVMEPEEGS